MGAIVSRLRRKVNTKDSLEKLDKDIKSLEQYHFSTQQKQKRLIGALLLYSIIVYIVLFVIFYLRYFPSKLDKQILYAIPLFIFPFIVYLIKKSLHWYFKRKISYNDEKLRKLRQEKKKILENVMETETYKVAKDLLDKFDTEKLNKSSDTTDKLKETSAEMELRRRSQSSRGITTTNAQPRAVAPVVNGSGILSAVPTPRGYVSTGIRAPSLARPILPKDRGVADRLIEYLIGDGPNARYALICRRCSSHNGMALKEEFEFLAFRCCYCHYPNPARKQRPNAPKLPESPQLSPRNVRRPNEPVETSQSEDAKSEGSTEEELMSEGEDKKEKTSNDNQVPDIQVSETKESDQDASKSVE